MLNLFQHLLVISARLPEDAKCGAFMNTNNQLCCE